MPENKSDYYLDGLTSGNEVVIKLLYDNFFPKIRNFIFKNNGNLSEAEEVFQNALFQLSVRSRIKKIDIKSSFEAYLFTVCKNLWRKELNLKNKWVRNDSVDTLTYENDNHTQAIIDQERWELFHEKLEMLSENCRELLKAYFKKIPYEVITKQFSYTTKNVAFQRIFKCKKQLTKIIKEDSNYRNLI